MSERVFLLNEDRSFQVEYTMIEAEMEAEHGLWTEDEPPQPMWTPFYQGGEIDEQTLQVSGGQWVDPGAPTEEDQSDALLKDKQARLTALIQAILDDFAKTGGYDSILSLCTYATSSVEKFRIEGQYGVDLRDQCWMTGYAVLAEIAAGQRDWPTDEEAIAMMPSLRWPEVE